MKAIKKFLLSISCLAIILTVLFFAIWLPNKDSLIFLPDVFITEYLKILGGIIPIIFGFLLLDLFWDRWNKERDFRSVYKHIGDYLQSMSEASHYLGETKNKVVLDVDRFNSLREYRIKLIKTIAESNSKIESLVGGSENNLDFSFFLELKSYLIKTNHCLMELENFDFSKDVINEGFYEKNKDIGDLTFKLLNSINEYLGR